MKFLVNTTLLAGLLGGLTACEQHAARPDASKTSGAAAIRLNQIGYPPGAEKLAVVPAGSSEHFSITASDGATVYRGELGPAKRWRPSGETVRQADFTDLHRPGRYRLHSGDRVSAPFEIRERPYRDLHRAALKAYYYNRAGIELKPEYAGRWARPAGHAGGRALIHRSAASENRPAGTELRSPGGWYDAGDYNQYVVNSGISTYTLLAAYEHFPEYYEQQKVNIPESGNRLPDILDEALWNMRWMLTMQDRREDGGDGGVYHKLTAKDFVEDDTMPHESTAPRYMVQKSTAAALDFAATAAVCARVFRAFEDSLPDLAERCQSAAVQAWNWARDNPDVHYRQPDDIGTGEYAVAHEDFVDEFIWAAAELYLATGDATYREQLDARPPRGGIPHWEWSAPLAWISLTAHGDTIPEALRNKAHRHIMTVADRLLEEKRRSAYAVAMGAPIPENGTAMYMTSFEWGSNANAGNQALMLLQAYRMTGRRPYLDAAQANLDYLLGRNATGYNFVTGFGDRSPRHPHHRPSMADNVAEPVPGFLVGGPHGGRQDARSCAEKGGPAYPSSAPAKSYIDHTCSYATNEVTINWNAPLVYVSGALDYYHAQ